MLYMPKEMRINVRTTPQIKRELEIAARLRGITPSALVNSVVVKAIREEKEREPQAFQTTRKSKYAIWCILSRIESRQSRQYPAN